jgi:nucleoside-diphosphate kinase
MAKPDAVHRGLIGRVITRLEDRGLQLVGAKFTVLSETKAKEHYGEHQDKPFVDGLVDFITAGPDLAVGWEGDDATKQVRDMMGATDPADAAPGTIRGDYALDLARNVIHGSDNEDPGANTREISLFFDDDELVEYDRVDATWVYE